MEDRVQMHGKHAVNKRNPIWSSKEVYAKAKGEASIIFAALGAILNEDKPKNTVANQPDSCGCCLGVLWKERTCFFSILKP